MLSYLYGSKTEKKDEENENPELAMRDALDEHGEFETNADGTMVFKDYCVLRSIITRQTNRAYAQRKIEDEEKLYKLYLEKQDAKFAAVLQESTKAHQEKAMQLTQKACEWIEFDPKLFQASTKALMQVEENQKKLMQLEQELLEEFIVKNIKVTISVEKTKEIYMWMIKEETALMRRIQNAPQQGGPQQNMIMRMIGQAKMNAQIRHKFEVHSDHFQAAISHYKLKEDPQIKGYLAIVQAQLESERKKELEECRPPQELIDAMIKRVASKGKPQIKKDKTMTFDYFVDCIRETATLVNRHTSAKLNELAAERRQHLKEDNKEAYNDSLNKAQKLEQQTSAIVDQSLFQSLQVPQEVYVNTTKAYMLDQAKAQIIQEEIQAIKLLYDTREKRELTREECIASKRTIDKNKYQVQQQLFQVVKSQKLPPQMLHTLMKNEKMKQDDMFFNEMGFEEADVEPSIKRLGIEKDPELLAIKKEAEARAKKFLEDQKVDTEKIAEQMKKMREEAEKVKAEADKQKAAQLGQSMGLGGGDMDAALH